MTFPPERARIYEPSFRIVPESEVQALVRKHLGRDPFAWSSRESGWVIDLRKPAEFAAMLKLSQEMMAIGVRQPVYRLVCPCDRRVERRCQDCGSLYTA